MTEHIKLLLDQLKRNSNRKNRKKVDNFLFGDFRKIVEINTPALLENDDFGFNMTAEIHLPGGWGNLTPNYYRVMTRGFDTIIAEITENMNKTTDPKKLKTGEDMIAYLSICVETCDKYRELARNSGNIKLYNALCRVPRQPAETLYEACVFMKLCIFFLRLSHVVHIGLGRFDQYMLPFYRSDIEHGVSEDELFETLEAFFIALNRDADLYDGIQQGDNGQSMVLGGFDINGKSMFNELSQKCMEASLELSLIDPKINLRVGKNTPDELYVLGTRLTKQGLGFPQYCNDDVVIPGLIKLGYTPEDAANYVVAACWEFIIPGCGADVPNVQTLNFPVVVDRAIHTYLYDCETFDDLMVYVEREIEKVCALIVESKSDLTLSYQPLLSVFTDGCTESLTDIWNGGAKYCNFGCHGLGIAPAADALAAIKKVIFDDKSWSKAHLLNALNKNFEGYGALRDALLSASKMGNNDDYADEIGCKIMDVFSRNINNRDNCHGGIWRAGTGSAQDYYFGSRYCPATADGRLGGEPFPSSYSPSLDVKTNGLLSAIQSFTKFDLSDIINGGPMTIEIHDTVFRNDVGIEKTAMLVKSFISLGGHQLQLNSINRERLIDAQAHPENYPNLIVRVWGWSGYFNELDIQFQNHVIRRLEYTV